MLLTSISRIFLEFFKSFIISEFCKHLFLLDTLALNLGSVMRHAACPCCVCNFVQFYSPKILQAAVVHILAYWDGGPTLWCAFTSSNHWMLRQPLTFWCSFCPRALHA
jgi:hypothetical protein